MGFGETRGGDDRFSAHDGQPDLSVVWCVHDEAHAWPNLTSDCHRGVCFDAGSAIWAFFSSFR